MEKGGVGFFDSGVGGLTVLDACLPFCRHLPIYYFGDNTHVPYGDKSREELRGYVFSAFDLFLSLGVVAAVVACNTVTALLMDELRRRYSFPIIGIEPAVMSAAQDAGEIYVLTTCATHASARFNMLLRQVKEKYPQARVRDFPCKGLADAVERTWTERVPLAKFLPAGSPNAVVLGCTHYSYLKAEISAFYGARVYDGNDGVARCLSNVLKNRDGRPLCEKTTCFRPFVTTLQVNKIVGRKIGRKKRKKHRKNDVISYKVKSSLRLYFLGEDRLFNRSFYEQMFVFKKKRW